MAAGFKAISAASYKVRGWERTSAEERNKDLHRTEQDAERMVCLCYCLYSGCIRL